MSKPETHSFLNGDRTDLDRQLFSTVKGNMKDVDTKPLLSSKVSTYTDGAKSHECRRRATGNPDASPRSPSRSQTIREEIEHAAAETYLLTRLTFILLGYLGYHSSITQACCVCNGLDIFPLFPDKLEQEKWMRYLKIDIFDCLPLTEKWKLLASNSINICCSCFL